MNHKKRKNRNTTAGCHYCKGWKLPCHRARNQEEFEKHSDHVRRMALEQEMKEAS